MRNGTFFSFRLLLRLFFSLAFFVGGAAMVFWAQGFRFDFGNSTIVSTGVVSVSSLPSEADIVVDSEPRGKTPNVLLGFPLGSRRICFYREEFTPYCTWVDVDNISVRHIFSVVLLPQQIVPTRWGSAEDFFWDPWNRGFVQIFRGLSSAYIFDGKHTRFFEPFPSNPDLPGIGELFVPFVSLEDVFSSDPVDPHTNVFLPDDSAFLFVQGNILSLRIPAEQQTLRITAFQKPIEDAFFLPESESILASTNTDIVFIARPGENPIRLFPKTPICRFAIFQTNR
jgi:hypothetical protein